MGGDETLHHTGGAVVSVLRADTGLPERCLSGVEAAIHSGDELGLALVLRCQSGTRIWL